MFLTNSNVPRCCYCSSLRSINQALALWLLMIALVESRGIVTWPESSEILLELRKPLRGVKSTSLWPALISPSPKMIIGVIEMIVIMMIDAKTNKHIVETERQLSNELLLILTVHSFLYIVIITKYWYIIFIVISDHQGFLSNVVKVNLVPTQMDHQNNFGVFCIWRKKSSKKSLICIESFHIYKVLYLNQYHSIFGKQR